MTVTEEGRVLLHTWTQANRTKTRGNFWDALKLPPYSSDLSPL